MDSARSLLTLALGLAVTAPGQLLELEVHVTKAGGARVLDLEAEDFAVVIDGKDQPIVGFDFFGSLPGAEEGELRLAYEATKFFVLFPIAGELGELINNGLYPGDELSLAGAPFSDDQPLLIDILKRAVDAVNQSREAGEEKKGAEDRFIEWRDGTFGGPYFSDARFERLWFDKTMFDDAFDYLGVIERLSEFPGRKVIIASCPGPCPAPKEIRQLSAAALWTRTRFYTSDQKGVRRDSFLDVNGYLVNQQWEIRGLDGPSGLFTRTGKTSIEVLRQAAVDRDGYYVLAIEPTAKSFKELEIRIARPDLEVTGGLLSDKSVKPPQWLRVQAAAP